MGWMHGIMVNAIDRRLISIGGFVDNIAALVADAVKTWEVAARNFQADLVPWQKDIGSILHRSLVSFVEFY